MATTRAIVRLIDPDRNAANALESHLSRSSISIAAYETIEELRACDDPTLPGCVVVDVRPPSETVADRLEKLAGDRCQLPVIAASLCADVETVVACFRCGAADFIQKPFQRREVLGRIKRAVALDASRRAAWAERDQVGRRAEQLTRREMQVLDRVVAGLPNKRIAAELGVCVKTVEAHRARVMTKMEAVSLPDLVRMFEKRRGA